MLDLPAESAEARQRKKQKKSADAVEASCEASLAEAASQTTNSLSTDERSAEVYGGTSKTTESTTSEEDARRAKQAVACRKQQDPTSGTARALVSNIHLATFILATVTIARVFMMLSESASTVHFKDTVSVLSAMYVPTQSSGLPLSSNISCSSMAELKQGRLKLKFAEVNGLRRHLLIENRPCFQSNSQFFIETFLNRTSANHVMLHIPKTGGTTLCKQVKEGGIWSTAGHNCWKASFCPMWAGCVNPQPTSCSTLKSWPQTFVMNENYLDKYCDHRTYSIMIREPVSRAMSHLNHFMEAVAWREDYKYETMNWRLSLVMSNYMVWALSAITVFDNNSN